MRSFKLLLASSVGLVAMAAAVPTMAQIQPAPPERYTLDERSIDLVTGQFNYSTTEVVIGQPGAGGLTFGRIFIENGWRDTNAGTLTPLLGGDIVVSVGPISEYFNWNGSSWDSATANGSTLTPVTGGYDVVDRSGNKAHFASSYMGRTTPYGSNVYLVTYYENRMEGGSTITTGTMEPCRP